MQEKVELTAEKKSSCWIWLGCVLMVIAAALHSADKNIGGGDTWVAMACGRYYTAGNWAKQYEDRTIQMKVLDVFGIHMSQNEPFSNKSRNFIKGDEHKVGWINQNWLTHVIFYKMFKTWGGNSIVYFKFIQAILTALFAYWAARKFGAHALISAIMVSFGVLLSRSYIDLRPNITTILFASMMIYLLACWAKGQPKKLLWMFPITIIWCNVHGGFIYAVIIFAAMAGMYALRFIFTDFMTSFFMPDKEQWKYFFIAFGSILFASVVFSPYGLENLTHPFLVMLGNEGDIWRNVSEWRSIYFDFNKPQGHPRSFGNVGCYIVFLGLWAVSFVLWVLHMMAAKTKPDPFAKKKNKQKVENKPVFQINLGWVAIMLLTVYISIQSRRFVFLGGLVLAPFVALMIQDIIDIRIAKGGRVLEEIIGEKHLAIIAIPYLAAVVLFSIFVAAMNDIYFKPSVFGWDYSKYYSYLADEPMKKFADTDHSMFWHMVGIKDQPVQAMRFVNDNNIRGTVMGEWTGGGFIPYGQTPGADGRPGLRAFMDGRAQAAYEVEHFQLWQKLRNPDVVAGKYGDYLQMLNNAGIEVAVLKIAIPDSRKIFEKLMNTQKWKMMYIDGDWVVIVHKDSTANKDIIEMPEDQIIWHNKEAAKMTLAINNCALSSAAFKLKGIDIALSMEDYEPMASRYLASAARLLKAQKQIDDQKYQQVIQYFLDQRSKYLKLIEENPRLGKIQNNLNLCDICGKLGNLTGDNKYAAEAELYLENFKALRQEFGKGGLLW
ncbi:MAG: hypothetical protein JEZ07_17955 [Phycisphaerae bacterium]|nr:hypothetical protein [Phycisphaerae bacterium]